MPIQFLDTRVSIANNTNTGTGVLSDTTPLLVGDIGLQVVGTVTPADIRVSLWGTLGVSATAANEVTITIERGGNGTSGSGTVIFTATVDVTTGSNLITVHAADFQPPFPVSGELRYSMYALDTGTGPDITVTGPITFSGHAVSGTT